MNRRLLPLLLLLLLVLHGAASSSAQTPEDTLQSLVSSLQQQSGRAFTVVEYTFEAASFQNSALDCPSPGESPITEQIPGYRWTLLLDDGLRYRIHSNLDASQIVLCPGESSSAFDFTRFDRQGFHIDYPNLWNPPAEDSPTLVFLPIFGDVCGAAGMELVPYATFSEARSALNERSAAVSPTQPLAEAGIPHLSGVTTVYRSPCDGGQRQWRLSAVEGPTTSYLIAQWSPEVFAPVWDRFFLMMLQSFQAPGSSASAATAEAGPPAMPSNLPPTATPGVSVAEENATPPPDTSTAGSGTGISAPPAPTMPPLPNIDLDSLPLVHVFGGDLYRGSLAALPGLPLTANGTVRRSAVRVAPQTQQIAFVEAASHLHLIPDPSNSNFLTLSTQLSPLPPTWSLDGQRLLWAESSEDPAALRVQVRGADGAVETLGLLPFNGDCEDAPAPYDVDRLYGLETGPQGNLLSFALLPDGSILYTPDCSGIGLARWTAGDSSISLGDTLMRAQLSPNREKVAALNAAGEIIITDLSDNSQRRLIPTESPSQLAWDATGTQLFYSSHVAQESLLWETQDPQKDPERILGVFPFESRLNRLRIFRVDTQSLVVMQLWEGEGFAIGRMLVAPDNSGLLLSIVPSDRELLQRFSESHPLRTVLDAIPETQLYWLPMEGGNARLLAISAQPAWQP